MLCKKCGAEVNDSMKFCQQCGGQFSEFSESAETPGVVVHSPLFTSQQNPSTSATKKMSFSEAVKYCLSNYVNFKGRASRSEYWFSFHLEL
jgi:predicted amidophosphoribosyltransferase